MGYHGPISSTSQCGNKYIICLTDVLSKFVITKAVHDNTAQTAVRFLKKISLLNLVLLVVLLLTIKLISHQQ